MNEIINKEYFARARVGLFTHYTYATYNTVTGTDWGGTPYSAANPRGAVSAEEAAALFDGEAYAKTARDLGAQYVVFTLAHAGFNLLFPSETMKATGCTHKCTETADLPRKLMDGLAAYGIPLVFYLPPNDDHDIVEEDLKKMGWFGNREARMQFLIRLVNELYDRYGTRFAGFWFDQCGPDACVKEAILARDPNAVVFVNTGVTANEQLHPLSDFIVSEYYGSIEGCDSDTLPVHYSQVNRQIGNWWAQGGKAPTSARICTATPSVPSLWRGSITPVSLGPVAPIWIKRGRKASATCWGIWALCSNPTTVSSVPFPADAIPPSRILRSPRTIGVFPPSLRMVVLSTFTC